MRRLRSASAASVAWNRNGRIEVSPGLGDVGAANAKDAAKLVGVGDLAVLEQPLVRLANGRIATRAADNRCGAFVAAEAVRLYAEKPGSASLTGVATVGSLGKLSFAPELVVITAPADGSTSDRSGRPA